MCSGGAAGQLALRPAEQPGAEHGCVDGEPLRGIGGSWPARVAILLTVGHRPDRQRQPPSGLGDRTAGGEVGLEGGQQRFGTPCAVASGPTTVCTRSAIAG
jgi:hypothetical protein